MQRARLVEGAMEAIRQRGPEVSTAEMASFAGVSKPVIYGEFGDKLGVADAVAVVLAERVERKVVDALGGQASSGSDVDAAIGLIVDSLVSLIEEEPQLYVFLVRSIRSSGRGFLDNALVRLVHRRASVLVGLAVPDVPDNEVAILTDGVFGFVFGAVESWQATKQPTKERLVLVLSGVIRAGLAVLREAHTGAGTAGA